MKRIYFITTFFLIIALISCDGPNAFEQFSNQSTNEALYQEALKKIDSSLWQEAIDIIEDQMSSNYSSQVKVKEALIGAYAGKCGFTFVNIVNGLSTNSGGMFELAIASFSGAAIDTTACDSAVSVLQALGTSTARTQSQNLFASMLGLAMMGVNLHRTLDTETGGLGNGSADAGADACTVAASLTAGKLTNAQVAKIGAGMGLMFENITTLAAALAGGNAGLTAISSAKSACDSAVGVAGGCTITDPATILASPTLLLFFRKMIMSNTYGIGNCDLANCCP